MVNREHYLAAMKLRTHIRSFFVSKGFQECETPICVRSPGMEPNLVPFETTVLEWNGEAHRAGLITSPEYSLKKLLGTELPKIFEIARVFRNHEALDATHNPEFTMLEWYRAGEGYETIMRDTEELVRYCSDALGIESGIWNQPWRRMTVDEAFRQYVGFSLLEHFTRDSLAIKARELGIEVPESDTFEDIFFRIFGLHIERKLGHDQPVILYEYPASMASLARLKSGDPRVAERFEVYIKGIEVANAFGELTDPVEQRKRFEFEAKERRALGKTVFPVDEALLAKLGAIGQASGIALGVDRLAMLLTGASQIEEVLAFSANELFKQ